MKHEEAMLIIKVKESVALMQGIPGDPGHRGTPGHRGEVVSVDSDSVHFYK